MAEARTLGIEVPYATTGFRGDVGFSAEARPMPVGIDGHLRQRRSTRPYKVVKLADLFGRSQGAMTGEGSDR